MVNISSIFKLWAVYFSIRKLSVDYFNVLWIRLEIRLNVNIILNCTMSAAYLFMACRAVSRPFSCNIVLIFFRHMWTLTQYFIYCLKCLSYRCYFIFRILYEILFLTEYIFFYNLWCNITGSKLMLILVKTVICLKKEAII